MLTTAEAAATRSTLPLLCTLKPSTRYDTRVPLPLPQHITHATHSNSYCTDKLVPRVCRANLHTTAARRISPAGLVARFDVYGTDSLARFRQARRIYASAPPSYVSPYAINPFDRGTPGSKTQKLVAGQQSSKEGRLTRNESELVSVFQKAVVETEKKQKKAEQDLAAARAKIITNSNTIRDLQSQIANHEEQMDTKVRLLVKENELKLVAVHRSELRSRDEESQSKANRISMLESDLTTSTTALTQSEQALEQSKLACEGLKNDLEEQGKELQAANSSLKAMIKINTDLKEHAVSVVHSDQDSIRREEQRKSFFAANDSYEKIRALFYEVDDVQSEMRDFVQATFHEIESKLMYWRSAESDMESFSNEVLDNVAKSEVRLSKPLLATSRDVKALIRQRIKILDESKTRWREEMHQLDSQWAKYRLSAHKLRSYNPVLRPHLHGRGNIVSAAEIAKVAYQIKFGKLENRSRDAPISAFVNVAAHLARYDHVSWLSSVPPAELISWSRSSGLNNIEHYITHVLGMDPSDFPIPFPRILRVDTRLYQTRLSILLLHARLAREREGLDHDSDDPEIGFARLERYRSKRSCLERIGWAAMSEPDVVKLYFKCGLPESDANPSVSLILSKAQPTLFETADSSTPQVASDVVSAPSSGNGGCDVSSSQSSASDKSVIFKDGEGVSYANGSRRMKKVQSSIADLATRASSKARPDRATKNAFKARPTQSSESSGPAFKIHRLVSKGGATTNEEAPTKIEGQEVQESSGKSKNARKSRRQRRKDVARETPTVASKDNVTTDGEASANDSDTKAPKRLENSRRSRKERRLEKKKGAEASKLARESPTSTNSDQNTASKSAEEASTPTNSAFVRSTFTVRWGRGAPLGQSRKGLANSTAKRAFSSSHGNVGPKLRFQIPSRDLAAAMTMSPSSSGAYWSHTMYRGEQGEQVRVFYCRDLERAERALQEFIGHDVLGVDLEWEPGASTKVSGIKDNVSVIQVAAEDKVAVIQLALFAGNTVDELMPPTLRAILEDQQIVKAGVNIAGDFSRLNHFLGIQGKGLFETSHTYNLVRYSETLPALVSKKMVALDKQVQYAFGLPLFKGAVRTSAWSKVLNGEQIRYAATDAYAGLRLYYELDGLRRGMNPTPPLPALHELGLPILLANGLPPPRVVRKKKKDDIDSAESEKTATEVMEQEVHAYNNATRLAKVFESSEKKNSLATTDDAGADENNALVISTREVDEREPIEDTDLTGDSSSLLGPGLAGPSTANADNLEDLEDEKTTDTSPSSPDPRVADADEWCRKYRARRQQCGKSAATAAAVRAYVLWHQHSLSVDETAAMLREQPLRRNTVRFYIVSAVAFDANLPFDHQRMKEVVQGVPRHVLLNFRSFMKRLGQL